MDKKEGGALLESGAETETTVRVAFGEAIHRRLDAGTLAHDDPRSLQKGISLMKRTKSLSGTA